MRCLIDGLPCECMDADLCCQRHPDLLDYPEDDTEEYDEMEEARNAIKAKPFLSEEPPALDYWRV